MPGFNLDFEDVYEGRGQIKDGYYEVLVNRANEDATPSGAEYAEFDLIIRNDIDQPHQNQHIFEKQFKSKKTHKYNMTMSNTIGKASQLENGKTYNGFNELLDDFTGKTALVYVKNETSEYNGKTYENLNVKMWNQTKYPDIQHVPKSKEGGSPVQTSDVSDHDLPF